VAGIVGLGAGLGLGLLAGRWTAACMGMCGTVGVLLPVNWLRREARFRTRAIRKALPYSLDLLTLAVMAGLDFTEAMMRLSRKLTGSPLGYEMTQTVRSIQLGKSRGEALRDLSWRVGMIEMSSVTGSIIQADELGASLGPILRIQAEQIRTRRFHAAEEQAMKAPVKIIFPLALCILPTTMLIIFGSLAIPYMDKIIPLLGAKLGIR
jgi:tight adherence protein C